ncbi:glycoside hydrolase family 125 protein [Thermoflexus sp.]|uniref:glycoside hydrolase family 125 protein n=1 Tax=Thermoflexus sp. TaxID=1969742 RepID=UPI0035E40EDF
MSKECLMTRAPILEEPPVFLPTGNLELSIPWIDQRDGSVYRLGALHEHFNGLIEAEGDPLIRPVLFVESQPVAWTGRLSWRREGFWIPVWRFREGNLEVEGRLWAPIEERGLVYQLRLSLHAGPPRTIALGFEGRWARTLLSRFTSRPLHGSWVVGQDPWTGSGFAEFHTGLPLLALGLQAEPPLRLELLSQDLLIYRGLLHHLLHPGEVISATLYLAVAPDADGARTGALHLRRRGADGLLEETRRWLEARARRLEDPALTARLNENLFFAYFFSQGDCLDTGAPVMVTSRSPLYYVSGAFWSRDAFLWSFPAILLVDPERARFLLRDALPRYLPHIADHALYLNGVPLYPGFELDQAAAPLLAIWRYVRETGDIRLLQEPVITEAIPALLRRIEQQRDAETGLYRTFLLPTDDPTEYPLVIYDNVLVWAAFRVSGELFRLLGKESEASHWELEAEQLAAAIRRYGIVEGPEGPMWAWARDQTGRIELREEPPGSLRLLAYYGFCDPADPVYQNTVRWLSSPANPYFFPGPFGGPGSPHFPFPGVFDLANRLLTDPDPAVLELVRKAPMDNGLACESIDPQTGVVRTGAAMASLAGFLAWALWARARGHRNFFERPS